MPEASAPVRLPDAKALLRKRSNRLEALARRSGTAAYLEFLARLLSAQRAAAENFEVQRVASAGSSPLDPIGLERTSDWRSALRQILASLSAGPIPDAARTAIEQLTLGQVERHEALAEDLLSASLKPEDIAQAPYVAAALQVYWSHLAGRLDPAGLARDRTRTGCPACGFPPVAGYVTADGQLRYLSCSLCSTEWRAAAGECAACGSSRTPSYHEVEGAAGAVKAEACDDCRQYVKVFYLEKDGDAEPHADDVATLPLDMLMADARYHRAGRNLLLQTQRPVGVNG
jgi:FdhE protein